MREVPVQLVSAISDVLGDGNVEILKSYVLSGEFRDEEFTPEVYISIFGLVELALSSKISNESEAVRSHEIRSILIAILQAAEFEGAEAAKNLPSGMYGLLVNRANPARINLADSESDCRFIEVVLRILYSKMINTRCMLRSEIGKFLREFSLIPTRSSHLTPILNVLNMIVTGMSAPDLKLFREILLPLHKPNGWSFWDRQTAILGEYHKSLVQCCYSMIEKENSLATELIDFILTSCFPPINQSNTAKELLLLFEMNKFINYCDIRPIRQKLVKRLYDCISSENAQIVQSALMFWKSPPSDFPIKIRPYLAEYMENLLLALFRGSGEPHWNPTVNKMTLLVLTALEEADPEIFADSAQSIPPIDMSSFKNVNSRSRGSTVPKSLQAASHLSSSQPPLETTGVAPWQFEPTITTLSESVPKTPQFRVVSGLEALREYMNLLQSDKSLVASGTAPSWQSALSSETPTLLPDLKFHNLVFGRDLGVGAFSTVRYARVVKPKTYLSQWDEVAVKVISYETIRRDNYAENVLREICALRKLSHPSIARLISSFRWRDGIYMVLEYGALGDLHSYVRRTGGLAESQAKMVIGEILTAVITVHESGFVYGDLKPENVVITASRHVKLADFGACRPITDSAKNELLDSRNELRDMRSGDWKAEPSSTIVDIELSDEAILNPKVFEGTTAYLSPEISGGGPTIMSDAWALGLTTYFTLKGRLPNWLSMESNSHFNNAEMMSSDPVFSELSPDARDIIYQLLVVDPSSRMSVAEVMEHAWFNDVQPIRALYKRVLDASHLPGVEDGRPSSQTDSLWEKRQLSKVWTAQPVDFALGSVNSTTNSEMTGIPESDVERDSPFI
jgi:serine/threonine protein kinase